MTDGIQNAVCLEDWQQYLLSCDWLKHLQLAILQLTYICHVRIKFKMFCPMEN